MGKKRKNMKKFAIVVKIHRGTLQKQANRKTDKRKRGAKPMVQHPEVYEKK